MEHFTPEERKISQPEEGEGKGNGVFLKVQNELLRRAGCVPENNARCEEWIAAHAEKLREIVTADPSLLDRWATSPEETLREIETMLE